ncbi:MAG TPA: PD-(D/E)XK nuclease family protein [Ilumatobacteraceae bacterium]|nr:PD-(D/E)XK nuclease family protein [Ilumatobacteraceae bacterium]HUC32644.1 PD-(D/E)XK nuclease family protein [Ilumatobacteraceae bacterium]
MQEPVPVQMTPAQSRTLELLRRTGEPKVFDESFVDELRAEATDAFAEFHQRLGERTLFVTKHTLSKVHGCEAHYLAPDEFEWTPARARGQIAHKAIQLLINWKGEPTPRDLVDDALARIADEERDFGRWVASLSPGDEAELRGAAIERVNKFVETFPPLDKRSNPATEAAAQWPLDDPILLRARVDLVMGRPEGRESRKLIIDLKTGRVGAQHREDLRFYALVETLVRDVPPRKLATFYLDSAAPVVEDVTEPLLRTALRRTLDGIHAIIELENEARPPVKRTGASCRWCPVSADCAEGTAYLRGDDPEFDGDD